MVAEEMVQMARKAVLIRLVAAAALVSSAFLGLVSEQTTAVEQASSSAVSRNRHAGFSVRVVPTPTATMADRRSIGRWRGPHRAHLMVPATAGSAPGGRNTKVRPLRAVRPQF